MARPRTAVVTGGAKGIGLAISHALMAQGLHVVALGRDSRPRELSAEADYHVVDLAADGDIRRAIEVLSQEWSALDVLVNNAGINIIEPIDGVSDVTWRSVLDVNLTAPFAMTQACLPLLRRGRAVRVLNISSIWGVVSKERRASYSAAKTGLIGLTRSMAIELAPEGVLVNALCPGFTMTELTRRSLSDAEADALAQQVPLGRFAKPEEIGATAAFLCSEANTYMTGQCIVVDGGFTIR